MPDLKDPTRQSDFSSNKGTLPWDNGQLKPGAKDSVGSQSNDLKPFEGSVNVGKMGPFGGEKKS
jgi:hypothetical protein